MGAKFPRVAAKSHARNQTASRFRRRAFVLLHRAGNQARLPRAEGADQHQDRERARQNQQRGANGQRAVAAQAGIFRRGQPWPTLVGGAAECSLARKWRVVRGLPRRIRQARGGLADWRRWRIADGGWWLSPRAAAIGHDGRRFAEARAAADSFPPWCR